MTSGSSSRDQPRQLAIGVGTGHHIHDGFPFEQLLPESLGHTPHNPYDEPLAGPFVTVELPKSAPYPLFGIVADGTGIHQNDIGLRNILRITVSFVLHDGNEDFAVADIHLAPVCLHIEPLPVPGKRPQIFEFHITYLIDNRDKARPCTRTEGYSGNALKPSPKVSCALTMTTKALGSTFFTLSCTSEICRLFTTTNIISRSFPVYMPLDLM